MIDKGVLIIISGFSGAGKGTVVKELLTKHNYTLSISMTTRDRRAYEVEGEDYFFVNHKQFEKLIKDHQLIEWAQYCNNYYGTPKQYVEENLDKGNDVILEIEMQGALEVKKQYPDAALIFVTAPKAEDLKARLEGRGTEAPDIIMKRLKRAYEETAVMDSYDYIVVNDVACECADEVHSIIKAEHRKTKRNIELKEKLIKEFRHLLKGEV